MNETPQPVDELAAEDRTTPRPWKVFEYPAEVTIEYVDQRTQEVIDVAVIGAPDAGTRADAALIVEAVNAYDGLRAEPVVPLAVPASIREAEYNLGAADASVMVGWSLRTAISVIENYGDHHEWCAGRSGDECSCGLVEQVAALNEQLAIALSAHDRTRVALSKEPSE